MPFVPPNLTGGLKGIAQMSAYPGGYGKAANTNSPYATNGGPGMGNGYGSTGYGGTSFSRPTGLQNPADEGWVQGADGMWSQGGAAGGSVGQSQTGPGVYGNTNFGQQGSTGEGSFMPASTQFDDGVQHDNGSGMYSGAAGTMQAVGAAPGDNGSGIPPQLTPGLNPNSRVFGALNGYKVDPTTAMGTPYERFITGGDGTGPLDFNRAAAYGYMHSGGVTGPGQARAGVALRRAAGPTFGPNAAGNTAGQDMPTGVMATNPNANPGIAPSPSGVYGMPGGPTGGTYTPSAASGGFLGADPTLAARIGNLATVYGQQLGRTVLPQIRSNAILAGGYGGSKSGIAEGLAAGDAAQGFSRDAMSLLGTDWTNSQNRGLQKYQGDQQFYLGNQGQMLNFASDQRAQDRADLNTGASLYGAGTNGMWDPIKNANGVYSGYTGYGTTTTPGSGGGWLGALGGAGTAAQLLRGFNWGG